MNYLKTSMKLIKTLLVIFYLSSVAVHLLVILKVIPYDWVSGGMSKSYGFQAIQSVISIVIILCMFAFVLKVASQGTTIEKWKLRIIYFLTTFWGLGLIMQIIGTTFERYCLSLALLLGLTSHVLLIRKVRSGVSSKTTY